jgi:hypothetical protein
MTYERNLRIGVDGYTDNELVLSVFGDEYVKSNIYVGGNANISGILTANRIISSLYGEFTGNTVVSDSINANSVFVTGVTTSYIGNIDFIDNININSSGIVTATRFSTGVIGTAINITSDTITGPSTIIIDPSGIGDATGSVRIKGDLYVDGTNFLLNKITIDDFGVGIATQISSNIILDGAGIGIGSDNIKKSLTYEYDSDSLKSSENFDLADGKVYKINGVEVLSSTNLSVQNINLSGIASVKDLRVEQLIVSGISTLGTLKVSSGIVTATSGIITYYGDGSKLVNVTTQFAQGLIGTPNIVVGIVTATEYYGVFKGSIDSGVTIFNADYADVAGIATVSQGLTGTPNIVVGIVTATDFNSTSDINLKENIDLIENPIDSIMRIDGVRFNWKKDGRQSMGVIAQQLETIIPQLVSGDEYKTVNYNGLVGLLIEVVKEHQKQIDELKLRIDK